MRELVPDLFTYDTSVGDSSQDEEGDLFLRGNSSTNPPKPLTPGEGEYTIAVWVLSGLLVILSAILVFVVAHIVYNHRRVRAITLFPHRRRKAVQQRIARRYETIEGWLISKRVQDHTEFCETCIQEFSKFKEEEEDDILQSSSTMETAGTTTTDSSVQEAEGSGSSNDGSHTEHVNTPVKSAKRDTTTASTTPCQLESARKGESECPICFEEFTVGQVISYSANPLCTHVFHHTCIKEWLVHHVTCPFCREVCMPVDQYRGRQKHEHIDELLEVHSKRSATTYFCIQEGLVTIPCRIRCTNKELKKLQARICDCIVERKELATMRGDSQSLLGESTCADNRSHSEVSIVQEAVLHLEATSERPEEDFDPMEVVDDDIAVYAQGHVEGSGRQRISVEETAVGDETTTSN